MNLPGHEKDGYRPNSGAKNPESHCAYCNQPLGIGTHAADCVTQIKTVVVLMKVELVLTMPQSWSEDHIQMYLNESSYCSENAIRQLVEEIDSAPDGSCNTCIRTEFEVLRDATEHDHERLAWKRRPSDT